MALYMKTDSQAPGPATGLLAVRQNIELNPTFRIKR